MAAFVAGVGLADAKAVGPGNHTAPPGEAFRALVAGVRTCLIARASIKSEFRIEQTMIRARGNNPLKFSADDDDAIAALLGVGRRTDMAPAAAVAEALRDIRLHELASMAAMQSAVRAVLAGLDPDKIRAGGGAGRWPDAAGPAQSHGPGMPTRRCISAPFRRSATISTACSARHSPAPMRTHCDESQRQGADMRRTAADHPSAGRQPGASGSLLAGCAAGAASLRRW